MHTDRDRDGDAGASKRGNNGSNGAGASGASDQRRLYDAAFRVEQSGNREDAREPYIQLAADGVDPRIRVAAINSLAVLDALQDRFYAARKGFKRALCIDPTCENAQRNLAGLESCGCGEQEDGDVDPLRFHDEAPTMNSDSDAKYPRPTDSGQNGARAERPYPDGLIPGMTTLRYDIRKGLRRFSFAHDRTKGVYAITNLDGTTEHFRDDAVRYLVVKPDPETGELRPAVKRDQPVYLYLCREQLEL